MATVYRNATNARMVGGTIDTPPNIAGSTLLMRASNGSSVYTTFATLTCNATPTMDLSDSVTKANNYIYRAGGTDIAVADGGLGVSTVPSNGQIPIGNGTGYTVAALTAGTGIGISNGAGTITISASGGVSWSDKTSSFNAAVANGYTVTGTNTVTATLPTTFAVGDVIQFICQGSSTFVFQVLAGTATTIYMGDTSISTSYYLKGQNYYNAVTLVGTVANTSWTVTSAVGTFTVTAV